MVVVPSLELLQDVDTRWSSIFLTIDHVLDLAPVSIVSFAFNIFMLIYLHRHLPFFWTN
jgi:hypothetical protein